MHNWKEVNVWSSTVYSCDFHEGKQHLLLMFVLKFVLFFNLFTLASDFHEGSQYFMLMLVLNFAF